MLKAILEQFSDNRTAKNKRFRSISNSSIVLDALISSPESICPWKENPNNLTDMS